MVNWRLKNMSVENDVLKHFKLILSGLMISLLIVSLDSTITSTAT